MMRILNLFGVQINKNLYKIDSEREREGGATGHIPWGGAIWRQRKNGCKRMSRRRKRDDKDGPKVGHRRRIRPRIHFSFHRRTQIVEVVSFLISDLQWRFWLGMRRWNWRWERKCFWWWCCIWIGPIEGRSSTCPLFSSPVSPNFLFYVDFCFMGYSGISIFYLFCNWVFLTGNLRILVYWISLPSWIWLLQREYN